MVRRFGSVVRGRQTQSQVHPRFKGLFKGSERRLTRQEIWKIQFVNYRIFLHQASTITKISTFCLLPMEMWSHWLNLKDYRWKHSHVCQTDIHHLTWLWIQCDAVPLKVAVLSLSHDRFKRPTNHLLFFSCFIFKFIFSFFKWRKKSRTKISSASRRVDALIQGQCLGVGKKPTAHPVKSVTPCRVLIKVSGETTAPPCVLIIIQTCPPVTEYFYSNTLQIWGTFTVLKYFQVLLEQCHNKYVGKIVPNPDWLVMENLEKSWNFTVTFSKSGNVMK